MPWDIGACQRGWARHVAVVTLWWSVSENIGVDVRWPLCIVSVQTSSMLLSQRVHFWCGTCSAKFATVGPLSWDGCAGSRDCTHPPCCHLDSRATESRFFDLLFGWVAVGHPSVLRVFFVALPLATRWPKGMDPSPNVMTTGDGRAPQVRRPAIMALAFGFAALPLLFHWQHSRCESSEHGGSTLHER